MILQSLALLSLSKRLTASIAVHWRMEDARWLVSDG
jgi:hypothetical protein